MNLSTGFPFRGQFVVYMGDMYFRSLCVLLVVCASSLADEASHREAAVRVLEITNADKAMQSGFQSMIDPIVASMRQRGMPDAAAQEVKVAFNEWFTETIKWEDLKPKMAEIYMQQFTEAELKDLIAFYQTPTGKKAIEKLPTVTQQSAVVGREHAQKNGESLQLKLKQIAEKYTPKKGQ
jgi:uncharacterized protein